ncbi:alginate lyase family protein [Granulicella mallensis]|uniref:Alginate lyase domain-containing protein n=1 Tax=Granulicella mallensis TaxID=940614 RepID=A0A7W7ZU77_9BACT|nr:alginate lyase family protein [Granulicella mallensis]MBB5065847.1 hypothetical protein [Granulicella mallensis]
MVRGFWLGLTLVMGFTAGSARPTRAEAPCGQQLPPTVSGHGASWAIFPPESLAGLKAQAETETGRSVVRMATTFLSETPHPMARIHTEGTLPHHGIRDESVAAEKDWDGMLALGLAYRLTGDKKYLAAEDCYLGAWTAVYRVSLNPIDETNLDKWMLAYDLTRGNLSPKTEEQTAALWKAMAAGYIDWMEKNGQKDTGNWSSHRVKLAVMAAYEAGDPALEARAAAVFREQVKRNIRPDGSVEDFYKRDALHYVVYDLDPLQMAALSAKVHGESWFHEGAGGRNIAHGVDWLVPYAVGQTKHMEFVHSTVAFDAARDKAGEKGYSGEWDPAAGVQTLTLAALLDPQYASAARQCVEHSGHNPQAWLTLFGAVVGGSVQ